MSAQLAGICCGGFCGGGPPSFRRISVHFVAPEPNKINTFARSYVHDDERIDRAAAARELAATSIASARLAISARPAPAGSMPLLQLAPPLRMPSGQAMALT